MINRLLASGLAVLLAAGAASAQQDGVMREAYTFLSNDLTIEVRADAPGELRVVRGQAGRLEVAARAGRGIAGAGLAGTERDRLELTGVGVDRVAYLVVVPEDARVRVRLPDRVAAETLGTMQQTASYRWNIAGPGRPSPGGAGGAGLGGTPAPDRMHIAYAGGATPRLVTLPSLDGVRTLTVRWQGDRFRIETERPMNIQPGRSDAVEIRAAGEPQDIVLVVPRRAGPFELRLDGSTALVIDDRRAAALCEPLIEQRLDGERRWFTFTPDAATLQCEPAPRDVRSTRATDG